jgi:hypothetical protein
MHLGDPENSDQNAIAQSQPPITVNMIKNGLASWDCRLGDVITAETDCAFGKLFRQEAKLENTPLLPGTERSFGFVPSLADTFWHNLQTGLTIQLKEKPVLRVIQSVGPGLFVRSCNNGRLHRYAGRKGQCRSAGTAGVGRGIVSPPAQD